MATNIEDAREAIARRRARYLTGFLWHVAAFVIINAFFWLLDGAVGESGFQWAYWITLFWGLGLAFHAVAWFIEGRDLEGRKTRQYLEKDR